MSTIYRVVGPDEGVCICHVHYIQAVGPDEGVCMLCPLYTGLWGLIRGSVYAMSTIYRAVGPDEGVCIGYVHYIQGCGA